MIREKKKLFYEIFVYPIILMVIFIFLFKFVEKNETMEFLKISMISYFYSFILLFILESFFFYELDNSFIIKRVLIFTVTSFILLLFLYLGKVNNNHLTYIFIVIINSLFQLGFVDLKVNNIKKGNIISIILIIIFSLFFSFI